MNQRASAPADGRVLLLHWGRRNAGPLLLREYAQALEAALGGRLLVSGNPDVEPAVRPPAGVESFDVPTYHSGAGALLGLPRLLAVALRLRRWIRARRVTTVFVPMWSLWQTLAMALWLPRNVRYITTVHDAVNHPGMRNPVIDFCRRIELRRADVIVVYSTEVAAAVRRMVGARTAIARLELGAPIADQARDLSAAVPVVGFFGRLLEYKGLPQFAEAVALVAAERPVHAVVHGQGVVEPQLREQTAGLIEWHVGYVPEQAVAGVLDTMDLLVLPYQEASQSGVVLQAFAVGLPVVATPVGGLRDQVEGRGGVLADGTDARALADAIRSLIDDPARYSTLSRRAIASATERSWPTVASPLLQLMDVLPARDPVRGAP